MAEATIRTELNHIFKDTEPIRDAAWLSRTQIWALPEGAMRVRERMLAEWDVLAPGVDTTKTPRQELPETATYNFSYAMQRQDGILIAEASWQSKTELPRQLALIEADVRFLPESGTPLSGGWNAVFGLYDLMRLEPNPPRRVLRDLISPDIFVLDGLQQALETRII